MRQFAELLTGLVDRPREPATTVFRPRMAEPGAETVLGRRYGGRQARGGGHRRGARGSRARIRRPARHIARKLAVHFVADDPDPELVAHLEAAVPPTRRRADGGLRRAARASGELGRASGPRCASRSTSSWRRCARRGRGDAATSRRSTATPRRTRSRRCARMNQPIWGAPGPTAGRRRPRPGSSPPGLTARIDWASRLGDGARGAGRSARASSRRRSATLARDETRFAARGRGRALGGDRAGAGLAGVQPAMSGRRDRPPDAAGARARRGLLPRGVAAGDAGGARRGAGRQPAGGHRAARRDGRARRVPAARRSGARGAAAAARPRRGRARARRPLRHASGARRR